MRDKPEKLIVEAGKTEIGRIRQLIDGRFGKLIAVFTSGDKLGTVELRGGNYPFREIVPMVENSNHSELAELSYFLREGTDDTGERRVYIKELWQIVKRIGIEAVRVLVTPEGKVLLLSKGDGDIPQLQLPAAVVQWNSKFFEDLITPKALIDGTLSVTRSKLPDKNTLYTPRGYKVYLQKYSYNEVDEKWLVMIPVPPDCWKVEGKETLIFAEIADLVALKNMGIIDKYTFEFSLVAIALCAPGEGTREAAEEQLQMFFPRYQSNLFLDGESTITDVLPGCIEIKD